MMLAFLLLSLFVWYRNYVQLFQLVQVIEPHWYGREKRREFYKQKWEIALYFFMALDCLDSIMMMIRLFVPYPVVLVLMNLMAIWIIYWIYVHLWLDHIHSIAIQQLINSCQPFNRQNSFRICNQNSNDRRTA